MAASLSFAHLGQMTIWASSHHRSSLASSSSLLYRWAPITIVSHLSNNSNFALRCDLTVFSCLNRFVQSK